MLVDKPFMVHYVLITVCSCPSVYICCQLIEKNETLGLFLFRVVALCCVCVIFQGQIRLSLKLFLFGYFQQSPPQEFAGICESLY